MRRVSLRKTYFEIRTSNQPLTPMKTKEVTRSQSCYSSSDKKLLPYN